MIRIVRIAWDDRSVDHIARHDVTQDEVEQVIASTMFITRGRDDTYRAIGQTFGGRYLTVIVAPRGGGVFYVVTARDADPIERRAYHRH
jgi:hypothetical protein